MDTNTPPPSPPLSASSASEQDSTAPSTPAASEEEMLSPLDKQLQRVSLAETEGVPADARVLAKDGSVCGDEDAVKTLKAGVTVGEIKSQLGGSSSSSSNTSVIPSSASIAKTPTNAPPPPPPPPTTGTVLSPISSPSQPPPTAPRPTTTSSAQQPPPVYPRQPVASAAQRPPPGPLVAAGTRRPPAQALRAGVRGGPGVQGGMKIPPSLQAKLAGMASRSSSSTSLPPTSSSSSSPAPSLLPQSAASSPSLTFRPNAATPQPPPHGTGGMKRRPGAPGLTLAGMGVTPDAPTGRRRPPGMTLSAMSDAGAFNSQGGGGGNGEDGDESVPPGSATATPFSNFSRIVDPSGRLSFASKAIIHADGVDFSAGASFKIKMDDLDLEEELGKGNYGTVQKVWHKPTKVTMALKEIRLELDDSKLKTIITELDILHRATSPYIIDFYGAFFIESCVYYCMEYMDAGSLDKVAGCDIPEDVLSRLTHGMVVGLKFLKDELKIMHRDVKPTNVLINMKGYVKLCDFGVSGQLDRSLAKTNIGCQSYMAPERIKGESMGAPTSYTASSDVWSLGLTIIEVARGVYPYPPETYSNVFAQLTAIVHGDPPTLPGEDGEGEPGMGGRQRGYSEVARDFVGKCLLKGAKERPTYGQLLEHPFIKAYVGKDVDVVGWIAKAVEYRARVPKAAAPALA